MFMLKMEIPLWKPPKYTHNIGIFSQLGNKKRMTNVILFLLMSEKELHQAETLEILNALGNTLKT